MSEALLIAIAFLLLFIVGLVGFSLIDAWHRRRAMRQARDQVARERVLICMRLADMRLVHPEQIERACAECGEAVGVYPSGQSVMAQYPGVKILCHCCGADRLPVARMAHGALREPFQSVRQ